MKTENKSNYGQDPAADQKGSACVSRAGFGVAPKQSFPRVFDLSAERCTAEKFAIARRARQHARGVRYPNMIDHSASTL
jgi:hypothetical protein